MDVLLINQLFFCYGSQLPTPILQLMAVPHCLLTGEEATVWTLVYLYDNQARVDEAVFFRHLFTDICEE